MATNKRICTFDGCEQPHEARGYCDGHYHQQWRGKPLTPLRATITLSEHMDTRTDKTGDCWVWTAGKNKKGYGRVSANGKLRLAHCVAYELVHGPIPASLMIDHKCHNPACVRPEHLRLATNKQNGENRLGATVKSASGVRGVSWSAARRKWVAHVGHNGQCFALGRFATIEDAETAVIAKRLELFTYNDADRLLEV